MDLKELFQLDMSRTATLPFSASWSNDDRISVIAENGVHILDVAQNGRHRSSQATFHRGILVLCLLLLVNGLPVVLSSNVTSSVFGPVITGMPAAFGDFNSDDLTDLFVLRDSMKTLEILLASSDQEPLLKVGFHCKFSFKITSVVPGFFDGDPYLDVILTSSRSEENGETDVHILWGEKDAVNKICGDNSTERLFTMRGQPLAMDYSNDMIVDLFGESTDRKRTFWLFGQNRTSPIPYVKIEREDERLRKPHSHAFIDLSNDGLPDLMLSTESGFELWLGEDVGFTYNKTIRAPESIKHIGQSIFIDLELKGDFMHLIPVCFDHECMNTTIFVYADDKWHNLNTKFEDHNGKVWGFATSRSHHDIETITFRAGDYDLDGYPDLLATLKSPIGSEIGAYLLRNVRCSENCGGMQRTFSVSWDALSPISNGSLMGIFYDLYQDGVLDVLFLNKDNHLEAYRNTLDYDSNFVKVMVLTGPDKGGSYPGPRIAYRTTTQEGDSRFAVSAQLPQSAYFPLCLPYSTFGLGRTPNFIDKLTVGALGHLRDWTQIIPNSQLVVVLWSKTQADKWQAHLFVTPSKSILLSVVALLGTCVLITIIIGFLHWQEKRLDRVEKLLEAHRFHFDAM